MRQEYGKFDKEYLSERAKSSIVVDDKTALMTEEDLSALSEYSGTLPTGTFIGKRWKRKHGEGWLMGEFAPNPDPKTIDIIWREVVLV